MNLTQSTINRKRQLCLESSPIGYFSSNPDPKPTSEAEAGQDKAVIQLDVFDISRPPQLRFQRVPSEVAIAPDRFYISIEVADGSWTAPIQLTAAEVEELLEQAAAMVEGGVA